ncbi:transposase [Burkholderia pseudomallei]|nr:ISPsy18, transposase [Burkholderia pseudomallei MSHR346]OMW24711.1 transposase [Burkholderia pseudomallei]OMW32574.1 transposase [Burkholderia pseudomallei]OMW97726.1 transposase [Burkholderia pseudomallei]OMY04806.1 transposase [Burkholderia pseudomallei]
MRLPRDRNGGFEPILILKHGAASPASTSAFSARYARGMSVREIQTFLAES